VGFLPSAQVEQGLVALLGAQVFVLLKKHPASAPGMDIMLQASKTSDPLAIPESDWLVPWGSVFAQQQQEGRSRA
jgi:hypothetical protein